MTAATAHAWDSADAWTALHRAETTPHELAAIAAAHPAYATQIAAHPQAYPALVEWAQHVAGAKAAAPDAARSADVIDIVAGTRRESGAHPLAFSADADVWRAAVAAGSALTEGARPEPRAPRAGDLAADRVVWTPGSGPAAAGRVGVSAKPDAGAAAAVDSASSAPDPATAHAQPWWIGVAAADGDPAHSDPAHSDPADVARPAHRATFAPLEAQRAEAVAVGAAVVAPTPQPERPRLPDLPALPRQSAAAAARAAGTAYAAASAPAGTAAPAAATDRTAAPTVAVDARALLALVFAFVLAPLGIVFGHLALRDTPAGASGRGYAVAGLVVGYALVATAAVAAAVAALTLLPA